MSALLNLFVKLFIRKGDNIMAVIYATLIVKGKKTIDQVPVIIREQVKEILKDLEVEI
jgi:hypothetical protein